jgi:hypothetical protein
MIIVPDMDVTQVPRYRGDTISMSHGRAVGMVNDQWGEINNVISGSELERPDGV